MKPWHSDSFYFALLLFCSLFFYLFQFCQKSCSVIIIAVLLRIIILVFLQIQKSVTWQFKQGSQPENVWVFFPPAVQTLTSVRGSSASRLTAGIWSSLGLFDEDDDDDDDDDVACSRKSGLIRCLSGYYAKENRTWINENPKKVKKKSSQNSLPLGPLSLVLSRAATRSRSSNSLRKSRARTSSGASCVGCLRSERNKDKKITIVYTPFCALFANRLKTATAHHIYLYLILVWPGRSRLEYCFDNALKSPSPFPLPPLAGSKVGLAAVVILDGSTARQAIRSFIS